MRRFGAMLIPVTLLLCTAGADEKPLNSHVRSVELFKNGLAVVRRTAQVSTTGTYRLSDVPVPVHGTFWIESDAKVAVRLTRRVVEIPSWQSRTTNFQQELAGKEVTIHFSDDGIPPATGRVVELEPGGGEEAWNRTYQRSRYGYYGSRNRQSGASRMLVLDNKNGRYYVDPSRIAYLQVKGAVRTVKQRRPVLLLSVTGINEKQATIAISYLAKGMAWAPSYRVDISDPKTLLLQQKAVIKNELEGIEKAEIQLISGFPSIQFANVVSPLSLDTSWTVFFQQLSRRYAPDHPSMSNVATQQAVSFNVEPPQGGVDLSAVPAGEGVDLHYQEIGPQTLAEGDSLALDVASGKATYESIVEWIVPDTRQANGRYIAEHQRNQDPEKYRDAAWDAVRFRNPLSFPMTTAPAMIVSGGRFNGQRMSYWVNPGEQTILHVTKALSIRTRSIEHEVKGSREIVYVGGNDYRKTTVQGELRANNHRKEPVTLVIRRRFSGDLLQADRSPKCSLLEEGASYVNKRNELTWSLTLQPGEEVTLEYQYTLLVDC